MLWLFISRVQYISKLENTQNVKSWAVREQWKKGRTGIFPLHICCKLKWYLHNRQETSIWSGWSGKGTSLGVTWLAKFWHARKAKPRKISFALLSSSLSTTVRPLPFQNFKYGHRWASPCLFNSAHAKPNGRRKMSKLTNQSIYKQVVYTRKRYSKQCFQAHFPQSSHGFRATFFDPLSLPSWSFEGRLLRMGIKVRD